MATVMNCMANTTQRKWPEGISVECAYCEKEIGEGRQVFGLALFVNNDAGFDTMVVKKFCSPACKAAYRERVEQQIQQSPKFRLGEFETMVRRRRKR